MSKAIIHAATRVIRRLTSDASPVLGADETAADVPDGFDIAGGFWKLAADNKSKLTPTQAEIDSAGVDEEKIAQQKQTDREELKAALADAKDDILIAAKVRRVFMAMWKMAE